MTIIGIQCHCSIYGLILTLSKYLFVLFMHLNFVFYVPRDDHIFGRNVHPCVYKKFQYTHVRLLVLLLYISE